jgi:hypothetical protein
MKTWNQSLGDAAIVGSVGSLASAAALALGARREGVPVSEAMNAPAHMPFGDRALAERDPSLFWTGTGFAVHHGSAIFWALIRDRLQTRLGAGAGPSLANTAFVTALSALVDLKLMPPRLRPGFERKVSSTTLVGVYTALGIGMAVASRMLERRRA